MTGTAEVAAPPPPPPLASLVLRNVAKLGAGELLSRLIGFGATIYIARRLGVEAYGIIGFGFAVLLYATAVVDAGLEHTGPREVAEDRVGIGTLVSSLLIARMVWALAVTTVLLAAVLMFFSGDEQLVLALYVLALLPVGASTRWVHVGLDRNGLVAASRVISEVVRVLAIIALVRGPGDIGIVPLGQVAGDVLAAILLLFGIRACGIRLRPRFDADVTRHVLRRAAPMALSGLLAVMIYNVDLVFLRVFRDPAELGLYLAGYTLINFLGIFGHVIAQALLPTLTRLRAFPAARTALYSDAIARVSAAGIPVAVGGYLVAPLLITLVFGESYATSASVLAILIWSIPIVLVRSVLQAALLSDGRQDQVLRTTISAAVSNTVLNALAVPLFGMYGAAVTTVMAEAIRMVTALIYARRSGFPSMPIMRLARSAAAAAAMGAALVVLRPETLWTAIPLGAIAYALALLLVGGFRLGRSGLEVTV
jgi:O-antigen/teichoic acid export membrane protein